MNWCYAKHAGIANHISQASMESRKAHAKFFLGNKEAKPKKEQQALQTAGFQVSKSIHSAITITVLIHFISTLITITGTHVLELHQDIRGVPSHRDRSSGTHSCISTVGIAELRHIVYGFWEFYVAWCSDDAEFHDLVEALAPSAPAVETDDFVTWRGFCLS